MARLVVKNKRTETTHWAYRGIGPYYLRCSGRSLFFLDVEEMPNQSLPTCRNFLRMGHFKVD